MERNQNNAREDEDGGSDVILNAIAKQYAADGIDVLEHSGDTRTTAREEESSRELVETERETVAPMPPQTADSTPTGKVVAANGQLPICIS